MIEILASVESMSYRRDFLLKQIENEVSAGFALVAAARRAYDGSRQNEGDGALADALAVHQQAIKQISDSEVFQVRAIVHQLAELRGAIDWLRESHISRAFGER